MKRPHYLVLLLEFLLRAWLLLFLLINKGMETRIAIYTTLTHTVFMFFLSVYNVYAVPPRYRAIIDLGLQVKKRAFMFWINYFMFRAISYPLGLIVEDTNMRLLTAVVVSSLLTCWCMYDAYIPSAKLLPLPCNNDNEMSSDNSYFYGGSDLSDLHIDALQVICEKLVTLEDYVRFGAVCKKWRTVLWLSHKNIPSQLPLLVPLYPSFNLESFLNQSLLQNVHTLKQIHVGQNVDMLGSDFGWLLIAEKPKVQLVNLLLSVNNVIQLPSLHVEDALIKKVALSHNPKRTSNYSVMIIYQRYYTSSYHLALASSADESWTDIYHNIAEDPGEKLCDVTYYKDRFYVSNSSGKLMTCNTACNQVTEVASVNADGHMYLAKSSGDLLCVIGLQVFKLGTTLQLIRVRTLRDHAIFISPYSVSISVRSSDFKQCKPNHIYVADDYGMTVCKVEDETLQSSIGMRSGLIWIEPTLNMVV